MTVAIILDLPAVTDAPHLTARAIPDAARRRGNPILFAGSIAERWRDLAAWESPDLIEAFITSAAQLVADIADGEPTWEDAAWQ